MEQQFHYVMLRYHGRLKSFPSGLILHLYLLILDPADHQIQRKSSGDVEYGARKGPFANTFGDELGCGTSKMVPEVVLELG